jgi:hypothetical protein
MRQPSIFCLGPHGHREPPNSRLVGNGPGFAPDDLYRRGARPLKGEGGAWSGGW